MKDSRRDFLKKSSLALATSLAGDLLLSACASRQVGGAIPADQKAGLVICPGSQSRRAQYGEGYASDECELVVYDIDRDKKKTLLIPIGMAHGATLHPVERSRCIVFEITGDYACEVDLKSGSTHRFLAKKDFVFSGHGTFSLDGAYLYTSEYPTANPEQGRVVVRDGKSYQILSELVTYSTRPHDLTWVNGGQVLVISHYGNYAKFSDSDMQAAVTFVEPSSGKLLKKVVPQDPNTMMCHLGNSAEGKVYVLTANEIDKAGTYEDHLRKLRKIPSELRKIGYKNGLTGIERASALLSTGLDLPIAEMKSENLTTGFTTSLSIAIHDELQTVGMTHNKSHLITFWDTKSNVLKKSFSTDRAYPSGMTLTQDRKFFMTFDDLGHLNFYNSRTLEKERTIDLGAVSASGSAHIYGAASV